MRTIDALRIDRKIYKLDSDFNQTNDWRDRGTDERLNGLEILRQIWSNYDPDTERLQRVYTIIERTRG